MTLNKRIMRKLRTKQTISGVVIALVCLHMSCVYSDPAMNWSSRSLAGFRKLFQSSKPERRTSPEQTSQSRSYQSNSSVAPNRANILSVRNYSSNSPQDNFQIHIEKKIPKLRKDPTLTKKL